MPEKHLEFVSGRGQAERANFCESVVDKRGVVRGNGHDRAADKRAAFVLLVHFRHSLQHPIEQPPIICVDLALFLKGDGCWLAIGSFHQPNLWI